MHAVSVTMKISCAHSLECFEEGHPCSRVHGHNYKIEVAVGTFGTGTCGTADLSRKPILIDFKHLKETVWLVIGQWDHRNLDDVPDFFGKHATAEVMSDIIAEGVLTQLAVSRNANSELAPNTSSFAEEWFVRAKVWETDSCYAETVLEGWI